jgi:hypothetical protein
MIESNVTIIVIALFAVMLSVIDVSTERGQILLSLIALAIATFGSAYIIRHLFKNGFSIIKSFALVLFILAIVFAIHNL